MGSSEDRLINQEGVRDVGLGMSRTPKALFAKGKTGEQRLAFVKTGSFRGYTSQRELSNEQNQLLSKALRKMGLSTSQTMDATYGLRGTPRQVIETALTRAQNSQDGSGRNG